MPGQRRAPEDAGAVPLKRLLLTILLVALPACLDLVAQDGQTLRVYLARHGQTDGNLKGIAQGWTDTPLKRQD